LAKKMIRRFASLPLGGKRWFAATATSKFNPGDLVCWVDNKMIAHKVMPKEQVDWFLQYPVNRQDDNKNWYKQIFGTVISVDEETKLVKVNFDQNGVGAYATGTWDVEEKFIQRINYSSLYDVEMFTHDGKKFDSKKIKDKIVLILDMEDSQMPKATCWLNLKRMYLNFKESKEGVAIMFFPHWNNNKPAEWFSKQLGVSLEEEDVFVMKKLPCNGDNTQPAFRFLKQYHPGRVDWRHTQAGATTGGWNAPRWILDKKGRVAEKVPGGSWKQVATVIRDVQKRID